jgi:hypothetical protein
MKTVRAAPVNPILRVGLFLLFLLLGMLLFVVFSHMRPMLPDYADFAGRIGLILGFLAASLLARKSRRFGQYWRILFACFIASAATATDYYLPSRDWLLNLLGLSLNTPAGLAIDKLAAASSSSFPLFCSPRRPAAPYPPSTSAEAT